MSLSDRRLLGHDETTGLTEWYHFDEHTGGFAIETTQDFSSLLEVNKAAWNDTESSTRYGELDRVASVPTVVMIDLAKQGIVTAAGRILDDKKYRAWLNDPDNRFFRTRAGKL